MDEALKLKLKTLPNSSGVYFHKSKTGEIIYIGKAAILKNRVKQYFQNTCDMDIKTQSLVAEIADTDWIETESEIDALFLEAEMVKRYMPRYNILLRDDKSLIFVRIDMKNDWPYVSFTRNPADDGAEYFGPYYNGFAVKKALRYLRRIFPYYDKLPRATYHPTKLKRGGVQGSKALLRQPVLRSKTAKDEGSVGQADLFQDRLDLDAHLGLSPVGMTSDEYKANLRKLISYIKGNRKTLIKDLESDMKKAAKKQDFETAAIIRNQSRNLRELRRRIMFGDKEFLDISKDQALRNLTDLLGLAKIPVRIEGYDISHMSGVDVVASMVVFNNGVSDRGQYRKFKTRIEHNNDYFNMNETITRRLSQKNLKGWGKPDLILIDGGKGQLDAAIKARDEQGQTNIPFIGLAKKEEQIIIANPKKHTIQQNRTLRGLSVQSSQGNGRGGGIILNIKKLEELGGYATNSDYFTLIKLPHSSHIVKLLQRIRDESHRFAVSYHTVLKRTRQTASSLEEIPGIGPKTRSKLIRKFGSVRNLKVISESEIAAIIGPAKTRLVLSYLQAL